jgi:two-component system NtrC family sensor kinase
LILNAVKILCRKRTIVVRTYKSRGEENVVIEVEYDAPGITEHILPKIFVPFFITKSARKDTGFGLFVFRGIVTKLGGYISVETISGKGECNKEFLPTEKVTSAISSHCSFLKNSFRYFSTDFSFCI